MQVPCSLDVAPCCSTEHLSQSTFVLRPSLPAAVCKATCSFFQISLPGILQWPPVPVCGLAMFTVADSCCHHFLTCSSQFHFLLLSCQFYTTVLCRQVYVTVTWLTMCTCTHVHLYTCTCVQSTNVHVYMCTNVHVYMYTCTFVHLYTYMYICTHVHMYMCTNVHVHMYICTCTFVHMYICTFVHVYMYTLLRKKHPHLFCSILQQLKDGWWPYHNTKVTQ